MAPKSFLSTSTSGGKRKAVSPESSPTRKKPKAVPSDADTKHVNAASSVVLQKYYHQEISDARLQDYRNDRLPRPMDVLDHAIAHTRAQRQDIAVGEAVVHWFKNDLRVNDNHALSAASEKATASGVPLLGLYIISPQDFEAHLRAPVRVDFILRCLETLQSDLAALNIPLHVKVVEERKEIATQISELLEEWGAKHIFANIEYEVDELRRETAMIRNFAKLGIDFEVRHDTCVVPPGRLRNGSGGQYAVYTPWFRAWVAFLHTHTTLLEVFPTPTANLPAILTHPKFQALFNCAIPPAPENKKLSSEEMKRFAALWPAGEKAALGRLEKFCTDRIAQYQAKRNFPAETGTSSLSAHFAVGTLSARTAVKKAREVSGVKKLDGGNDGIKTWISEVAWRDFYRHVLVRWPYVCMYKPFKPEYTQIAWEENEAHLQAWKEGRTGYPIVDAAMRQLAYTGWMHNRLRMITASFLAKHLLLDWRLGEQHFMLHLIDGDFASNNGGWGWSASSGVDPQPYFRIFNPELQSEKFDKDGVFIRKWVPELCDVKGSKAIHDPYARGAAADARKNNYAKPIVVHKEARERCLKRFKEGLGR
ncbi:Deoxyribodipyrimidine photo-lyase [Podosphaera aphanis]|nr:Deoxyribodipyrimidine photo-lyase [Podosphaera aphanis]